MKKVIMGKELVRQSSDSGDDPGVRELFTKYWPLANIKTSYADREYRDASSFLTMQEDHVYHSNGVAYTRFPIPVAKIKVELDCSGYGGRRFKLNYIDKRREMCIAFKKSGWKFYSGFFMIKSKTVICNYHADIPFIYQMLSWLEENKYIVPRTQEEGEWTDKCNIVEIHDGVPEIVLAPVRTKFCTVGTDPEFEVVRNGCVIRPPAYYKGTGSDVPIGLDGAGSQVEFRPKSGTPEQVVENLKKLFTQIGDPITTLGNVYPLGGHIHIGLGYASYPTQDLLWLLDYFLGKPTSRLSGKARGLYMKYGAYEAKPWGFEYRTPPAAIFATPEFARLSMKICKEVTECYHNEQVIRVTTPDPIKEDYLNYCGFSEEEYDNWNEQIEKYATFMEHPKRMDFNISSKWNSEIPSSTQFNFACPNATWKTGKCSSEECLTCYPTTAPAAIAARQAMDRENLRARREMEALTRANLAREREIHERALSHQIVFGDEWSLTALDELHRILVEANYEPRNEIEIIGLSQSRRDNCSYGFELEGFTPAEGLSSRPHRYGVPYKYRMVSPRDEVFARILQAIVAKERSYVTEPVDIVTPANTTTTIGNGNYTSTLIDNYYANREELIECITQSIEPVEG